MKEKIMGGIVECDRSYWPECGTTVEAIPADLNTLWETHPDQASIFVAEALLGETINARISISNDNPSIVVYLWHVGGDTLTACFDLKEEIEFAASDYTVIRSEAQADETSRCLHNLQALEDTVRQAKSKLQNKLAEFRP